MKIVIDPGHGGNDSGAVGPSGLNESEVVLDIALGLADALKHLELETRLTRTSEVFVELAERCNIANDWGADFFVSIHANSNGPGVAGLETLYCSSAGEAFAAPIQQSMVLATGDLDRGLKYRSDLYVLNGTKMPSILAEVGFISNPDTEALFKSGRYRHLIADAIAAGIARHLNIRPLESSPM